MKSARTPDRTELTELGQQLRVDAVRAAGEARERAGVSAPQAETAPGP